MPVIDDLHQVGEDLTVLLAQQGNKDAFRRLVDLYDKRLLYFVRRILGEAEGSLDILQSVYMLLKHFSSQWNPYYWMLVIGVLLIAVVLLGRGGLLGMLQAAWRKLRRKALP